MDSSTVIVAKVAYHIPEFDPEATYAVSAVFAGAQGGTFNRGGGHAQIRSSTGIVTVRHSLATLFARSMRPTTPLTGTFFLLQHEMASSLADTIQVGDSLRVRTVSGASAVRARSRTFYFNGGGPSRSFAGGVLDLLEEYWTYRPHKALAIAHDSVSRWAYGYAWGNVSRDGAIERALYECRAAAERRQIGAACRIVVVDEGESEH